MIGPDWQQYFHYLCWAIGTLTLTLLQYLVFRKSTDDDQGFLWITGLKFRSLAALLPLLFTLESISSLLAILLAFIMPIILLGALPGGSPI